MTDSILFREHRELLEDSLKTEREFKDIREMFMHIRDSLPSHFVEKEGDNLTAKVTEYRYDHRVDRDLYIVEVENWGVVGFCYPSNPSAKGLTVHPNFKLLGTSP
jgi:hypothetical protein